MRTILQSRLHQLLDPFSLRIGAMKKPSVSRYKPRHIPARETIEKAASEGISVGDYLEIHWNQKSHTLSILNRLKKFGLFDGNIETVLEIGTGAGIYAEKIIELCQPSRYESYETDREWADWLAREYDIISRDADGQSLKGSADRSIDLVLAHGLFIYIPLVTTYRYFQEIVRVTREGSYVAFDIFSEECFDDRTLRAWIDSNLDIPYFVRKNFVIEFFNQGKFKFIGEFFNENFDVGKSKYLVFQRTNVAP